MLDKTEGTIRRDGESYRDLASSSAREDAGPRIENIKNDFVISMTDQS